MAPPARCAAARLTRARRARAHIVFIDLQDFAMGEDGSEARDGGGFTEEDEEFITIMVGNTLLRDQPREVRSRLWYGAIERGRKEPKYDGGTDAATRDAHAGGPRSDESNLSVGSATAATGEESLLRRETDHEYEQKSASRELLTSSRYNERAWQFIASTSWPVVDSCPNSFYRHFLGSVASRYLERPALSIPAEPDARGGAAAGGGAEGPAVRVETSAADPGAASSSHREETTQSVDVIQRDLARTFPEHRHFSTDASKEELFRVLYVYSNFDCEVGYCQGMAFVAGMLLMFLPEHIAFSCFTWLMSPPGPHGGLGMRSFYSPGLAHLQDWLTTLDAMIRSLRPRLAAHFDEHGVSPVMFASDWILTLFSYTFSVSFACLVIDMILTEQSLMVRPIARAASALGRAPADSSLRRAARTQPIMKLGIMILAAAEEDLLSAVDVEEIITIIKIDVPKWPDDRLESIVCSASKMILTEKNLATATRDAAAAARRPERPEAPASR